MRCAPPLLADAQGKRSPERDVAGGARKTQLGGQGEGSDRVPQEERLDPRHPKFTQPRDQRGSGDVRETEGEHSRGWQAGCLGFPHGGLRGPAPARCRLRGAPAAERGATAAAFAGAFAGAGWEPGGDRLRGSPS